jgi:hypothetical protein
MTYVATMRGRRLAEDLRAPREALGLTGGAAADRFGALGDHRSELVR